MTVPHFEPGVDYYALLAVPRSASIKEIKRAFHRLVLRHHPDKQSLSAKPEDAIDIVQLTAAYTTLSVPSSKLEYDSFLNGIGPNGRDWRRAENWPKETARRPAEVVSLDEFDEPASETGAWTYRCRCGDRYKIREEDMEKDIHLLECGGCSEVVWVEYEEVEDQEEDHAEKGISAISG